MKPGVLEIRTAEGIVFKQCLAGPVVRCLALLVDQASILALVGFLEKLLAALGLLDENLSYAIFVVLVFILPIGYGMLLEWKWRGQTLGKKLFRLRVMDAEGLRLQFSQIAARNLLRAVDALPFFYLVGGLACWASPRFQRLGDLAANTVVVRHPHAGSPDLDRLLSGKFNSLAGHVHLAARLRQKTQPAEADLLLQALLRRETLQPSARLQLYGELAAHFQSKAGFPAEAVESLADEQFLKNIADILYRA